MSIYVVVVCVDDGCFKQPPLARVRLLGEAAHLLHLRQTIGTGSTSYQSTDSGTNVKSTIVMYHCLQPYNKPVFKDHHSASLSGGA